MNADTLFTNCDACKLRLREELF